MLDYREPDYENRRELLIQYTIWQMKTGDVDPAIWMMRYIFNRQEYNKEQVLWYIWLYANTYQLPTAYVIANEFPDYDLVDLDRLEQWNNENYHKLRYQVDCRYSKGHLPAMFSSYMENVGNNQFRFFNNLCLSEDRKANFQRVWDAVQKFHLFGRYKAWFYLQALRDVAGLSIDVPDLMLSDGGSESHRDGLCHGLAKDEWVKRKEVVDGKKVKIRHKFTEDELAWLEAEGQSIIDEVNERMGLKGESALDGLAFETVCCAFKKFFRVRDGRYCGYYLDRQWEDIKKVQADNWEGIEWDLLWEARAEMLHESLLCKKGVEQDRMSHFLDNGEIDWRSLFYKQQIEDVNPLDAFFM